MKTILIVEDEFAIADMLDAVLEDEGYRIILASNGQEGLHRALEVRPDLVICDIMMPVMDGRIMAQIMRDDPVLRSVPIIMMSAAKDAETDALLGEIPFISKPFELELLFKLIDKCISKAGD
jgi:CheY-like chemotaxis protein